MHRTAHFKQGGRATAWLGAHHTQLLPSPVQQFAAFLQKSVYEFP